MFPFVNFQAFADEVFLLYYIVYRSTSRTTGINVKEKRLLAIPSYLEIRFR